MPEHEKESRSRRMTAAVEEVRAAEVAAMQGPHGQCTAGNAAVQHAVHRLHQAVPAGAGQRPRHKTGDIVDVTLERGTANAAGREYLIARYL